MRCFSRTPAARQTRLTWPRCSGPTIRWPNEPPSWSTGHGRWTRVWSLRTVAPEGSVAERTGRLRAIRNEGTGDALADAGPLLSRGGDRTQARVLRSHGGGDPRPGRALGRPRPAARAAWDRASRWWRRILCLAQTVEVFHASGGLARRLPGRAQAPRGVVRPRPWSTRWTRSAPIRASGHRWTSPTCRPSSRPIRCSPPTRPAWTGSPKGSPR